MRGFFSKLRAAFCHSRGLFALNAGRLERAESLLRHAAKSGDLVPNPLLGESYLLLAATVERRGRRAEAVELFWIGMAEVKRAGQYSPDDVNYLGTYFCQLLQLAECQMEFQRFAITGVRKSLRRDFPMSLSKDALTS